MESVRSRHETASNYIYFVHNIHWWLTLVVASVKVSTINVQGVSSISRYVTTCEICFWIRLHAPIYCYFLFNQKYMHESIQKHIHLILANSRLRIHVLGNYIFLDCQCSYDEWFQESEQLATFQPRVPLV